MDGDWFYADKRILNYTNINDYVRWVANSLGINLSDEKIKKLGMELINDEKYIEVLRELEDKIYEERRAKLRRK